MARNHISDTPVSGEPVLQTPPGATPRGLRSDAFVQRESAPPLTAAVDFSPALQPAPAAAPRDWDFALPAPLPPKAADPLLDPDANWRRQVGLRAPLETASFPDTSRERFSENWERLAAEPRRNRRGPLRRKPGQSPLTGWLFTNGRFDVTAAAGPLLLLALITAAILCARQLFAGGGGKGVPAAEVRSAPSVP